MRGKITQWKEDKGFGFIVSEHNGERIFCHISDFKIKARRPKENDMVIYQSTLDAQGRLKAKSVIIEATTSTSKQYSKTQIGTETPKKGTLTYLAIFLLIVILVVGGVYILIQSGSVEDLMPAVVVILIIAVILIFRSRKPKEKSFPCSACRKTSNYNQRTISAWRRGFVKLYCNACHYKWLKNRPKQASGCFGMLALLVILPVMVSAVGVYQWVA